MLLLIAMRQRNISHEKMNLTRLFPGKRWPIRSCKGNALAGLLAGLLLVASALASSDRVPATVTTSSIDGIIAAIDAPALRLHVRTDNGRQLHLTVANVDAMRAVNAGDHVRLDVDGHGVVVNIQRTAVITRPIPYSRG